MRRLVCRVRGHAWRIVGRWRKGGGLDPERGGVIRRCRRCGLGGRTPLRTTEERTRP